MSDYTDLTTSEQTTELSTPLSKATKIAIVVGTVIGTFMLFKLFSAVLAAAIPIGICGIAGYLVYQKING